MTKYVLDLRAETADTEYGDSDWQDINFRRSVQDADELQEAFQKMASAIGFENYNVTVSIK